MFLCSCGVERVNVHAHNFIYQKWYSQSFCMVFRAAKVCISRIMAPTLYFVWFLHLHLLLMLWSGCCLSWQLIINVVMKEMLKHGFSRTL